MISVRVRFFGSLRDAVGLGECALTLPSGTADVLMQALVERLGESAVQKLREPSVRIAVNQSLQESFAVFDSGDEIAFMPPVTGG